MLIILQGYAMQYHAASLHHAVLYHHNTVDHVRQAFGLKRQHIWHWQQQRQSFVHKFPMISCPDNLSEGLRHNKA